MPFCRGTCFTLSSRRRDNASERGQIFFQHETARARLRRFRSHFVVVVFGDDHYSRRRKRARYLSARRNPVHLRHLDIHQNQIGKVQTVSGKSLASVCTFKNFIRQPRNQTFNQFPHFGVVINN